MHEDMYKLARQNQVRDLQVDLHYVDYNSNLTCCDIEINCFTTNSIQDYQLPNMA